MVNADGYWLAIMVFGWTKPQKFTDWLSLVNMVIMVIGEHWWLLDAIGGRRWWLLVAFQLKNPSWRQAARAGVIKCAVPTVINLIDHPEVGGGNNTCHGTPNHFELLDLDHCMVGGDHISCHGTQNHFALLSYDNCEVGFGTAIVIHAMGHPNT